MSEFELAGMIDSNLRQTSSSFNLVKISRDSKFQNTLIADFEITYKSKKVALIEIRSKLAVPLKTAKKFKFDSQNKYKVYIATDGNKIFLFNISNRTQPDTHVYLGTEWDKVFHYLKDIANLPSVKDDIGNTIYDALFELLSNLTEIKKARIKTNKINDKAFSLTKEQIKQSVVIDHEKKVIISKNVYNKEDSFEYYLLRTIIDKPWKVDKPKLIYRYSTLDAIISIINKGNYRLNGIQGMNDQREGVEILEKAYNGKILDVNNDELVNRLNDVFISSCSTKEDDLTLWRLYGDNSKGAYIVLEIKENYDPSFFINAICYFDSKKDEIVDEISFYLKLIYDSTKYSLDENIFKIFPFFFKPNHYKVEEEVRILFDRSFLNNHLETKFGWNFAEPYKIFRPYADIPIINPKNINEINAFLPFEIKKIILGPNCPFQEKNVAQINKLLREKGLSIKAFPSKIKSNTYIG